jgi:cytidine deaminase
MSFDRTDDPAWGPLIDAARAAMANSYSPYSHYPVGAALACDDGSVVAGCNVENASYGGAICAERGAVMTAIASGRRAWNACVVLTRGPEPAYPCGFCRQVLNEFAPTLPILLVAQSTGARKLVRLDELLPGAFGPEALLR